jgi:hypothetical protein
VDGWKVIAMSFRVTSTAETKAWYYTRLLFQRGKPGVLTLRDGRLTFRTSEPGSASSTWYVNAGDSDEVLFTVSADDVERISYNWLCGALSLTAQGRRHVVSFTGPPTGSHGRDVRQLIAALGHLQRWQNLLSDTEEIPSESH